MMMSARTLGVNELRIALMHMRQLLSTGLRLPEAAQELALLETRRHCRRLWQDVSRRTEAGRLLSEVLDDYRLPHHRLLLTLLRQGEATAALPMALADAETILRLQQRSRQRLILALSYPLFSLAAVLLATLFLLRYVVPAMAPMLRSVAEPSLRTEMLLRLSEWIQGSALWLWPLAVLLPVVLALLLRRMTVVRHWQDRCLLLVPLLGKALTSASLATYARCWGRLASNGLPHPDAMRLAEGAVVNLAIQSELVGLRLKLESGESLRQGVSSLRLPSLFVRLICLGEASGNLNALLSDLADQLDTVWQLQLERVESLSGPLVLLLAGGLMLFLVTSLLTPLQFSLAPMELG